MMKFARLSAIGLALAGTAVTSAHAGNPLPAPVDPMIAAPAPVISYAPDVDWSGAYVGADLSSGNFDDGTDTANTTGYGLHAGYLRDMGKMVYGAELAYATGDFGNDIAGAEYSSIRLKGIAGYDAGRLLPYALLGASQYTFDDGTSTNDTALLYGVGMKYAISDKLSAGLEYVVEQNDDFGGAADLRNDDVSLRIDYRF